MSALFLGKVLVWKYLSIRVQLIGFLLGLGLGLVIVLGFKYLSVVVCILLL